MVDCLQIKDFNLIKAFNEVSKITSKNLYIAGDFEKDNFKNQILLLIKEFKLHKRIKFLGFIEKKSDLINIIDDCSVVIYPSFYDAFPLTMIEAYSRGKPCLCSNISESTNFINDERFLFDPNNLQEFTMKWKALLNIDIDKKLLIEKSESFKPIKFTYQFDEEKIF